MLSDFSLNSGCLHNSKGSRQKQQLTHFFIEQQIQGRFAKTICSQNRNLEGKKENCSSNSKTYLEKINNHQKFCSQGRDLPVSKLNHTHILTILTKISKTQLVRYFWKMNYIYHSQTRKFITGWVRNNTKNLKQATMPQNGLISKTKIINNSPFPTLTPISEFLN